MRPLKNLKLIELFYDGGLVTNKLLNLPINLTVKNISRIL